MTDETEKFSKAARPVPSAQEQIRQMIQSLNEMRELLRQHQIDLRHKGMNLPARSLENVETMSAQLETLNNDLTGKQIQLRQLRALAQTTALINSSLDTDSVLNQVMDTVIQLTGAERGYIMLKNPQGMMEFRIARGIDREQLNRDDFVISNTIVNEVATTAKPVLTHNARNDPRYEGQESIVGYQLRSILAVPLRVNEQVIGVVYCDNRVMVGLFKEHELALLEAFANQAAVAIQNARLFEVARAQLAEITSMRDVMNNMFTSIASGLITLNGRDGITGWNRAAEGITGIAEGEAMGKALSEVLPALAERFSENLRRIREGDGQEAGELELLLDGTMRYWNVVMTPLRGYAQGVVIVLDDLTEQREREAQLTQVRRYLPAALVENLRTADVFNLGGQEREITVVSADVRGFSTFSERLQPEQLMEIINKYLAVASDSINLFEGVVDKYLGDAVIGLFNTPLNSQEDHAVRAVRAAMSMIYDVGALHEVLPPEQRLYYGVGIHTGIAVMGNVGSAERREFAALGDATEVSKLMQENAQRGEIILSASTYALISDVFECEALPPRKTKPDTDISVIYRLVGRKRRAASATATIVG